MRGTVRNRLLVLAVASASLMGVGVSPAAAAPVADQTQAIGTFIVIDVTSSTVPVDQVDLGSAFTAGLSGSLSKIDVPVGGYIQTGTKLDAHVRVWNVDAVSGLPTGAALATQVIPEATLAPLASGGTLSTTFTNPATVVAGTKYAFTVGFIPAAGTFDSILQISLGIGPAPGMRAVQTTNGNTAMYAALGMNFTTYVDDLPAPPPAPPAPGLAETGFDAQQHLVVAIGLLGLGVIALGIRRTVRRRTA